MDLDLDADQSALQDAVAKALARHGTDTGVLAELEAAGFLDVVRDGGPIEGVLVVEKAAEAKLDAPVAARVLVGPLAGVTDLPAAVGLVDGLAGSLCRWAPLCQAFLVLDGEQVVLADRAEVEVVAVSSAFGMGYGRVSVHGGRVVGAAAPLRRAWRTAIAAEAGATMLAAVARTTEHVTQRHQFGRPIGSFQAVQHRLATAYSMAVGTQWLARRAAWAVDDDFLTAAAAAYACEAAQLTYTNCHQVSGAIGVTTEFGLVGWTTRLLGLRQELGGQRAHAAAVVTARRAMPKLWPSPLPLP